MPTPSIIIYAAAAFALLVALITLTPTLADGEPQPTGGYHRADWGFDSERARRELRCRPSEELDHVVPLEGAYRYGGAEWDTARKHRYANDPNNWWCVPRPLNRSKGDRTLAEWRGGSCEQRRQIAVISLLVKTRYGLAFGVGETAAIRSALARSCTGYAAAFWCARPQFSVLTPLPHDRAFAIQRCGGLGD